MKDIYAHVDMCASYTKRGQVSFYSRLIIHIRWLFRNGFFSQACIGSPLGDCPSAVSHGLACRRSQRRQPRGEGAGWLETVGQQLPLLPDDDVVQLWPTDSPESLAHTHRDCKLCHAVHTRNHRTLDVRIKASEQTARLNVNQLPHNVSYPFLQYSVVFD